jgi:hypothetical protein
VTLQPIGESGKGEIFVRKERRLSHRVACKGFADALVLDTGYLFRGEIRDVSETGCFLMTQARLQLERLTKVDLLFVLNGRNYRTLARVMEVQPSKNVGLEFLFFRLGGRRVVQEVASRPGSLAGTEPFVSVMLLRTVRPSGRIVL